MKQFFSLIVLFLLTISECSYAQLGGGKWSFSNPKPFGFTCLAMSYADNNTALLVGVSGGIAKTTDGGGSFAYMTYTTNIDGETIKPWFNDVQFLNTSMAYAVGGNGVMIKSTDGGTNWASVTTPFTADKREINTVYFFNEDTGYIGGRADLVTNKPTLYKTTNGGSTWQTAYEFPAPAFDWQEGAIYKVRFSPTGVGYIGGASGLVWKFENDVWTDYTITPSIVFPNVNAEDTMLYDNYNGGFDTLVTTYADNVFGLNQQNYRGIAILNDTVVVVSTQNNGGLIRINTSTPTGDYLLLNNGSAPASRYHTLNSPQIYNLICKDGNTIAGTSSDGQLLFSTDKGFTWKAQDVYTPGSQEAGLSFFGVDMSPSGRIGVCGAGGVMADSVTQWRKPYTTVKQSAGFFGYSIETIDFTDANNGIAAGSGGTMLRTNDGGDSWEDISNPSFAEWDWYTSLSYISPAVLYAAASNGMLYKSADKGASFDLVFSEASNGLLAGMHFLNQDTGWIVSNNTYTDMVTYVNTFHSIIYRTIDGGLSWDSSSTVLPSTEDYSLNETFNDIRFFNYNTGYTVGSLGSIYKSTDGGITWVKQLNIPAGTVGKILSSISVIDENVAFVSGQEGVVMKTTNGGAAWQMCNTGLPGGFTRYEKILMQDASEGMVFGAGNVYTTLNGGIGWSPFYAPVESSVRAACFTPMTGCSAGLCKKVFAGMQFGGNILKFDADEALPVKFSNLTGIAGQDGNHLFWTAFAQEEVSYFEVQRSTDAVHFIAVGTKVYPGSLSYESYKWLDANAGPGSNFYRIKAVEKSGAIFYTNLVRLSTKRPAQWNYSVSNGTLILNNAKVQQGNITASVMNTAGQVTAVRTWHQGGGAFNEAMILPPAAKGICFVKIDNEGTTSSFRILVQ